MRKLYLLGVVTSLVAVLMAVRIATVSAQGDRTASSVEMPVIVSGLEKGEEAVLRLLPKAGAVREALF